MTTPVAAGKKRRWLPHPILSAFLVVIWLLLNNSLAAGQIVLGVVLGLLLPYLTSAFWPERVCIRRPWVLVQFIGIVLYDIIAANMLVALWVLGSNKKLHPAFMEMELELDSSLGISILASTISLTPGTVSCNVSADRKFLLIHALHVDDAEDSIQTIRERYERRLVEVLKPC